MLCFETVFQTQGPSGGFGASSNNAHTSTLGSSLLGGQSVILIFFTCLNALNFEKCFKIFLSFILGKCFKRRWTNL